MVYFTRFFPTIAYELDGLSIAGLGGIAPPSQKPGVWGATVPSQNRKKSKKLRNISEKNTKKSRKNLNWGVAQNKLITGSTALHYQKHVALNNGFKVGPQSCALRKGP